MKFKIYNGKEWVSPEDYSQSGPQLPEPDEDSEDVTGSIPVHPIVNVGR